MIDVVAGTGWNVAAANSNALGWWSKALASLEPTFVTYYHCVNDPLHVITATDVSIVSNACSLQLKVRFISMSQLQLNFSKCCHPARSNPGSQRQTHCIRLSVRNKSSRSDSSNAAAAQPAAAGSPRYSFLLPRQAVALFASGAVLGPFCDGLHSQHDVLHYANPSIKLQLQLGELLCQPQYMLSTTSPPVGATKHMQQLMQQLAGTS